MLVIYTSILEIKIIRYLSEKIFFVYYYSSKLIYI